MAKSETWSRIVEESGVQVRVFERAPGSTLYRSVVLGGRKERKSLGHHDKKLAVEQARQLARRLAEAKLLGIRPGSLTLGQLFERYRRHKLPTLSGDWRKAAETRMDLFLRAWGGDLPVADVDQTRVDAYIVKRRGAELVPAGLRASPDGKRRRGWREARAVRDGTLDADFRWLSSVFNWARGHRLDGRRLLPENPLHDVTWPKERNVRRPVASHRRFLATMEHADAVDGAGRLRCIIALARYTGRRESAICELRAGDVLLTPERIRAALAEAGMDERLAEHMPHGALRWSAESDKMGILHITPISQPCREELDRYLRRQARIGDVPLFPSPQSPAEPIEKRLATRWLLKAERRAELPKLQGGAFHPYRRLWASERKNLPDVDVAAAGG
ncbi:MAG: site-specific integrase, partial [Gemmatimonadaceae bacterium]|nr:site-specific integrase [Gemmatimonadaceae bacterium]